MVAILFGFLLAGTSFAFGDIVNELENAYPPENNLPQDWEYTYSKSGDGDLEAGVIKDIESEGLRFTYMLIAIKVHEHAHLTFKNIHEKFEEIRSSEDKAEIFKPNLSYLKNCDGLKGNDEGIFAYRFGCQQDDIYFYFDGYARENVESELIDILVHIDANLAKREPIQYEPEIIPEKIILPPVDLSDFLPEEDEVSGWKLSSYTESTYFSDDNEFKKITMLIHPKIGIIMNAALTITQVGSTEDARNILDSSKIYDSSVQEEHMLDLNTDAQCIGFSHPVGVTGKYERYAIDCAVENYHLRIDGGHYDDSQYAFENFVNVVTKKIKSQNEPHTLTIPDWIRNNAKWWSEGNIADSDFVSGIQHMIKERIINMEIPESISEGDSTVPDWIRTTVGFWASGDISDEEFVNALKHLIKNSVIKV